MIPCLGEGGGGNVAALCGGTKMKMRHASMCHVWTSSHGSTYNFYDSRRLQHPPTITTTSLPSSIVIVAIPPLHHNPPAIRPMPKEATVMAASVPWRHLTVGVNSNPLS